MIITAKTVCIFLGIALIPFTISTIVLAVQKSNLQDELRDAHARLEALEYSTTAATRTTPSLRTDGTTEGPGSETATTPSGVPETTHSGQTGESTRPTSAPPSTTTPPPTTTPPATTTPSITTTPSTPNEGYYRLPDNLYPRNYDLYIHPDIETGNFSGQVKITIAVKKTTNTIVLHSNNLNINSIYVVNAGNNNILKYYLEPEREFLIIELDQYLVEGTEFAVGMTFEGTMLNKIVGLYSSVYTKADKSLKRIATSKFEPTYARQAFPCFDEPAMKATFDITLVHPAKELYHSLSNMDIFEQINQGDNVEVFFNRSAPMSTYLACFIVSDFEYKWATVDSKGIGAPFTIRVFATPEQLNKVDFALSVGKNIIEYYIQYFQIEYPLPKLDMAGIPDFVSGAMEHWGLVTFRETALLYEEGVSSSVNKQRIASVISHEFAHMWFGNLVTMAWWDDLWLNEGFASYIENKGVDSVYPEWKMFEQFITNTLHGVLKLDATLGSHPIIQTVDNPDQITEIFDSITYSKGSSVIRMLEDFMGEDNFRQAVTNYLYKFQYRNAVTDDFLNECNALNLGFDVKAIMRTWTEQMGLPIVEVEKISDTQFKLRQKRFFSNPNDYHGIYNDSIFNYKWSIPITYKTNVESIVHREWFYFNQDEIMIHLDGMVTWIKFNNDQMGYYRVNYPIPMWEDLADALMREPNQFSVSDRACLLNDVFALADSTQLSFDVALDMTKYLSKEKDFVPWSVASTTLTSLKRSLMFTYTYVNYKEYARNLIRPIYESVTWNVGDDHLQNRLRVVALGAACSLGLQECLMEASERFLTWLVNPDIRPHPDTREIIYYYGMLQSGNEDTWEIMWKIYLSETDANEKTKLMYGLSAIQVPWVLSRFINLAWHEEHVRGQDYFNVLINVAANPVGESLVWEYIRENWLNFVNRFTLNDRNLGNLIPAITSRFATHTKLEEMQNFFEKYPEGGAGTGARVRALETVKNNIVWLEQNVDAIGDWLLKQNIRKIRKYY